jgi:TUG ubiquitin-like domain
MAPLSAVVEVALSAEGVHNANPSACKLLLGKKEMDLNTPLRFANLPTGAKLQLITGAVKRSTQATSTDILQTLVLLGITSRFASDLHKGCDGLLHVFQARSGGWVWVSLHRRRACRSRPLRCHPLYHIGEANVRNRHRRPLDASQAAAPPQQCS